MRDWQKHTGMRVALGALVVASALTLWALVQAFHGDELPPATPIQMVSLEKMSGGAPRMPADINAAVENDLFAPDRSAPSARYRMPDEEVANATPVVLPERPVVLGTAVATDGRHFATVQLNNDRPMLVHVGDTVGTWVVRSIERGKIGLQAPSGDRVEVTVPKPGN
ncbi:MAG: hypothetical protein ABI205_02440 [Gemmatimonadaceae bacterium]